LAIVTGVSIFIYVEPTQALYDYIGLQVLPKDWHLELFGWSWLAFVSYFVFVGACYLLRRRGLFSALSRNLICWRNSSKLPLHKQCKGLWTKQFNISRLGDAGTVMAADWARNAGSRHTGSSFFSSGDHN
jgi:hypothetical protein